MQALTKSVRITIVALLVLAGIVSILLVDVNIPLTDSHWRPSGEPTSLAVTIIACIGRFAALVAIPLIGECARRTTES
jgi:hypothetical protein